MRASSTVDTGTGISVQLLTNDSIIYTKRGVGLVERLTMVSNLANKRAKEILKSFVCASLFSAIMGEFSVSKPLQEVSVFLDNHWNRDQVFRTLQYASTLCSGALEGRLPSLSVKFAAVASSVSGVRITLRLLDDLPNLAHTLDSWRRPKVRSYQ